MYATMPPIKKRTLKRYTFDSSKYDCLPHKRHLSSFPSTSPQVDPSTLSELSLLVPSCEEPSSSTISPLISGLPTDFALSYVPQASQEQQVECLLTGLPPLPAGLGVSTLSVLTGDSGEDQAEDCSAQPRSSSSVEEGEEEERSERATVRTERIQQRVRGLVMAQREQVRGNLSGEFLLSQKIKTLQVVRKALFVSPRTEGEREMRIRSIQRLLRYKQQVKQLLLHVVADIRRVRRVNSMRETEAEVKLERRHQEQMSQQLFRRKHQVLVALCSRMMRLRREALAARQASENRKRQDGGEETNSAKADRKAQSSPPQSGTPARLSQEETKAVDASTNESWRGELLSERQERKLDTPEASVGGERGWTTSALMRRALGSCVSGESEMTQDERAGNVGGAERMSWTRGRKEVGGGGGEKTAFGYKAAGAPGAISDGSSVDMLSSEESQKGGGDESSGAESSSDKSESDSSGDSSTGDG
eukprot:GHVS01080689.1.p1 GENE.GHVS01080689.1~~GHVS01080689.1.p1  ORF type:complete len:476 (+),score=100.34 GHVS01080689.1:97-1524(+)